MIYQAKLSTFDVKMLKTERFQNTIIISHRARKIEESHLRVENLYPFQQGEGENKDIFVCR